jgi:hypothetical protein
MKECQEPKTKVGPATRNEKESMSFFVVSNKKKTGKENKSTQKTTSRQAHIE